MSSFETWKQAGYRSRARGLIALSLVLLVGCVGSPNAADSESRNATTTLVSAQAEGLDETDELAGLSAPNSTQELSEQEAAILLQAMEFYNFSADEMQDELERLRTWQIQLNDQISECMAAEGFNYIHREATEAFQLMSGFEYQMGTEKWSERYGLGITTLNFVQESLPQNLVGTPVTLPVLEASETSPEALYLQQLGEEGRAEYEKALLGGPDSCNAKAAADNPEQESVGAIQFDTFDLADLKARSLASPEYSEARDSAFRCVQESGYDVISESDARRQLVEFVIESGFEGPDSVNYDVDPPQLSTTGEELLASLQQHELEMAAALWSCGAMDRQLNSVVEKVAIDLYVALLAE